MQSNDDTDNDENQFSELYERYTNQQMQSSVLNDDTNNDENQFNENNISINLFNDDQIHFLKHGSINGI